jgi:TPP-dependent 2-oxoacid decarboxylase
MREPIHLKRHGSQDFFSIDIGKKITVQHLFNKFFITADTIVIADVGDCLFGARLNIPQATEFLAPAFYTSMGFAVPACIGAQLANPKLRPIVIVGDGAF